MGKVKLAEPRPSYLSRKSGSPEAAFERALKEVRVERRRRDEALFRSRVNLRSA